MISDYLALAGLALSGIVAALSAMQVFWKVRAKKHLILKLQNDTEFLRFSDVKFRYSDVDEVRRLRQLIQKQIAELEKTDQARVKEGMNQPSDRGRLNYLKDIVTSASRSRQTVH